MTGIDTNVLVRYLVEDDQRQTDRVHQFFARCRKNGETVWISTVVLCEAAWVLQSVFGKSKGETLGVFEQLQTVSLFEIEHEGAIRAALVEARTTGGDVADHIIGQVNLAAGCSGTLTFDKRLRRAKGFSSL